MHLPHLQREDGAKLNMDQHCAVQELDRTEEERRERSIVWKNQVELVHTNIHVESAIVQWVLECMLGLLAMPCLYCSERSLHASGPCQ